ncbi:MAG: HupE/UreJ family protein [Pseudorhodoplanes sp.]
MKRAAGAATLVLFSSGAQAHIVIPGVGGFEGGLLHPFFVLTHALALIALGLLAGMQTWRQRLAMLAVFAAAMVAAFGLVSLAYATDRSELAVLALTAIAGLVLSVRPNVPVAVAAVLAALVGAGILLDSVPAVPTVRETIIALAGTLLAATAIIALVAFASAVLPAFWPRIGVRVAGSWIAASAILVLALRLAKL